MKFTYEQGYQLFVSILGAPHREHGNAYVWDMGSYELHLWKYRRQDGAYRQPVDFKLTKETFAECESYNFTELDQMDLTAWLREKQILTAE